MIPLASSNIQRRYCTLCYATDRAPVFPAPRVLNATVTRETAFARGTAVALRNSFDGSTRTTVAAICRSVRSVRARSACVSPEMATSAFCAATMPPRRVIEDDDLSEEEWLAAIESGDIDALQPAPVARSRPVSCWVDEFDARENPRCSSINCSLQARY